MRQLKISKQITQRNMGTLDKYLADIAKERLLTTEEEVALAQRIKEGDQAALDKLVRANLRFVVSVAKQYQNQGLSLQDLINEGNLGLVKAAQRFDETRGFKFISSAVWWIRQALLQAIADQSRIVRLPLNQVGVINKIKKETARLEQTLNRLPTTEEIATAMDMPVYKVAEIMKMNNHPQSIDSPIAPNEETRFVDVFVHDTDDNTDTSLMHESLSSEIDDLLKTLPENEAEVLRLFFGIGTSHEHTLDEIGDKLDLSRERVRQIKERALKKLRQNSKNKNLKSYL